MPAMQVLLVEDDADLAAGLALVLRDAGHQVRVVDRLAEAERLVTACDAVVTDVNLPDGPEAGIELVRRVKLRHPEVELLVMTGHATVPQAVQAMRLGAHSYLAKPVEPAELLDLLDGMALRRGLRSGLTGRFGLVGACPAMQAVFAAIDLAAGSLLPLLISGETGTGKELAAQAVHRLSPRASGPFIPVNCSAIPRELAESELFGHRAGSFTGATGPHPGRFALAANGTLLLDEIDALPPELQPKLLRALESGECWPVGATAPVRSDARVIASCNSDLRSLAEAGRFRADPFYRLDGLRLHLPPLRERSEDLAILAEAILARESPGRSALLANDALARLLAHPWPGNVRELVNALRRGLAAALARAPGDGPLVLHAGDLGLGAGQSETVLPFKEAQDRATADWSRRTVRGALAATGGNVAEAARRLQMDRTALFKLMRRLGLGGGQ